MSSGPILQGKGRPVKPIKPSKILFNVMARQIIDSLEKTVLLKEKRPGTHYSKV